MLGMTAVGEKCNTLCLVAKTLQVCAIIARRKLRSVFVVHKELFNNARIDANAVVLVNENEKGTTSSCKFLLGAK